MCAAFFLAINLRCHASKVSGVTCVATFGNTLRPRDLAFLRKPPPLIVSEALSLQLSAENTVFFSQVFNRILLLLIGPPGYGCR